MGVRVVVVESLTLSIEKVFVPVPSVATNAEVESARPKVVVNVSVP